MKLSIGEVGKIFNISRETLRFYDKIGILKPEINNQNGYRYYLFKHLEKLGLILGIKLLGVPLAEIKETIESEDLDEYKNIVLKQEEILKIKKKELEILEYHLDKTKKVIDRISHFENEYDFKKLKVVENNISLYSISNKNLLNSNIFAMENIDLEKDSNDLYKESKTNYVYVFNITDNNSVKEDENLLFIKEDSSNTNFIKNYIDEDNLIFLKENISGKIVSVDFYGTVSEINEYILSLNNYFDCPPDNKAYVSYEFYLPKKNDDVMYFVNINLKVL